MDSMWVVNWDWGLVGDLFPLSPKRGLVVARFARGRVGSGARATCSQVFEGQGHPEP